MLKIVNKQTLVNGAKVFGTVGVGVLTAKVGGNLAVRLSTSVNDFVAKSQDPVLAKGHVDAGAGALLDVGLLAGAAALKLVRPETAVKAAPFMLAGTVMSAYGPVLADKVVTKVEAFFDGLFKDSADGEPEVLPPDGTLQPNVQVPFEKAGGLVIDMPVLRNAGGLNARRRGGIGLGGELPVPRAGGLVAQQRSNSGRPGLGGELRRPGGLYASRGYGPRLGGEVR